VVDRNAWEHAHELIATDASYHVVGTQAGAQGVGHGDEQLVPSGMTSGVVRGFEPVDVHISSDELSVDALDAIDLALDGSQSGPAAAYSSQLVGPGIFTVLGGLRAIFRSDLSVEAALGAVVRGNLAVVDGSDATIRGLSALGGGPGACILRALTIARRAIPCGSAGRVVARFCLSVT